MQTSNFRKSGDDPKAVSICRVPPKFYKGKQDQRLAPTWELFKRGHYPKEDFVKAVLSRLDPRKIYEMYKDSILLCWEKEGDTCHRRWVAEWIEENVPGVKVPEVESKSKPHPFVEQLKLLF